jgi:hypothetical protein
MPSVPSSRRKPFPPFFSKELLGLANPSQSLQQPNWSHLARRYADDPVGYTRDVLRIQVTPDQQQIAQALLQPPYKVMVDSGHNLGKTFLAAALANWWFDVFDPGVVITTAPTERDVVDLLWTELRLQRERAGLPCRFIGARAPEMRTSEEHYAKGYTARKGESFQGRHRQRMFFIFDEGEGVDSNYWTTAKTMFKPELGNAFLTIGNPTTTTSQAYLESLATDKDGNPSWRVFRMSALDHPNIQAELEGRPPPIPNAVTLPQLEHWLRDWCEPVPPAERKATDVEWPMGSGRYLRPGPIAEARILGRRPSAGIFGVWSQASWDKAAMLELPIPPCEIPRIGCDVARFGDDQTAFHVRVGPVSVYHEAVSQWPTNRTVDRLKLLAQEWARWFNAKMPQSRARLEAEEIPIYVDQDGVGAGIVDHGGSFYIIPVSAATRAARADDYPNVRSELWFNTAKLAEEGKLSLSRLPRDCLARLRLQAMSPLWKLDAAGRRVVEPKAATKDRLGRSPDDMDALNLAYYQRDFSVAVFGPEDVDHPGEQDSGGDWEDHRPIWERAETGDYESAARRRGLFGAGRQSWGNELPPGFLRERLSQLRGGGGQPGNGRGGPADPGQPHPPGAGSRAG